MNMIKGFILSCSVFIALCLNAQQLTRCFTDEIKAKYLGENSLAPLALQQIENIIQQEMQQAVSGARNVITIPVVVHVLHDGDPVGVSENISDAQILSQIAILNQDFRRLNADANNTPSEFQPVAADIEIEFCLAQRDPDGNPTTGILRHNFGQATYTDIFIDNTIKPQTNWNRDNYLNIYTARFGGDIANILGYASQPGFAASLDGVVVGYQYFGNTGNLQAPFNKGRTATHEVGHWLGLLHLWGINGGCFDDDNISDTPVADAPNYGCPSYPKVSCSSNDMFMNYMDYTNDACMNIFTSGQKQRVLAVLNTVRSNIATSLGCVAPPVNTLDAALVDVIYPTANICENPLTPVVEVRNNGSQTLTSLIVLYQLNGGVLQQYQWTGSLAFASATYVTLPAINGNVGNNNLFVSLTSPNNGNDQNSGNNDKSLTFQIANPTQSIALPFSEGFETTSFPPSGWAIQNPDGDRTFEASNYGGFSNSFTGVVFDNFTGSAGNNPKNKIDGLFTPNFNLNSVNPRLSFSVAYARRNNNLSDSLKVFISTDCGFSWTNIYSKGGASLATAENTNQSFIPADTNWRKEIIGLAAYAIYPSVKFKFENKSDWGNNLYLDDINLEFAPTGIAVDENIIDVQVYPNPADRYINIDIRTAIPEVVTIEIFDMLGKSIFIEQSEKTAGWQKQIDFTDASKGVYFVKVTNGSKVLNRKVVVQ
jgi:hypothetical protein